MPDLYMVGTKHVTPLVTIRFDRVTLGLPLHVSALNAISCTFKNHFNSGLEIYPYAGDVFLLKETYKDFQQALRNFLYGHHQVTPWKPEAGKCPRQTFELVGDDGRRAALVSIGSTYGTPYTHFQFNPSEMTPAARDAFLALLADVFAEGYKSLYQHGVLSNFELAVDINGLHCADAVLIDLGKRRIRPYKNTSTVYCGRRGGPTQGKLYDKADEMGKTYIRTRWETIITDRHTTLRQFIEEPYPCPLKDFRLVRLAVVKQCLMALGLPPLMAHHIRGTGLRKTIPSLKTRQALMALLDQHPNAWGHASTVWPSFQIMLERFKPTGHSSGNPLVTCTSDWDIEAPIFNGYADQTDYDV